MMDKRSASFFMEGREKDVRCPCGNLNCVGLVPGDAGAFGLAKLRVGIFGGDGFCFARLHHMSFAVGMPEKVEVSVLEDGVYQIKCGQCGEIFGFFEVEAGFVLGYRHDLPGIGMERVVCRELLKLPNLPKVLGSYLCKGQSQLSRSPNSYVDFTQLVPRECDFGEILSYDTDMDVMFSPSFRDCLAGSFEGFQGISHYL
jgi:hypothetical protein